VNNETIIPIQQDIQQVLINIDKEEEGIKSGIDELDKFTRGFHKKCLTVVGGRASIGKSSWMVDIALNVGKEKSVTLFSLEMDKKSIVERMICNLAGVGLHKVKTEELNQNEKDALYNAGMELGHYDINIDDSPFLSPGILQLKLDKHTTDCVIIDYLQMMRLKDRQTARYEEIDRIVYGIRAVAKKYNVATILLCQLSRKVEERDDHKPRMSDFRESGGVEQAADIAILIHNPGYYARMENADSYSLLPEEAEFIIAKNRQGPTGTAKVQFHPALMSFRNREEGF